MKIGWIAGKNKAALASNVKIVVKPAAEDNPCADLSEPLQSAVAYNYTASVIKQQLIKRTASSLRCITVILLQYIG